MPYTATVVSTKFQLVLPDGNRAQAGDQVYLSDQDYAQMSSAAIAAYLTNVTPFASGSAAHNDSAPDSAVAAVNAAGAAVIGGILGTGWNQVTAAFVPRYIRDQQDECQSGHSGLAPGGTMSTDVADTTYTTPVTLAQNP